MIAYREKINTYYSHKPYPLLDIDSKYPNIQISKPLITCSTIIGLSLDAVGHLVVRHLIREGKSIVRALPSLEVFELERARHKTLGVGLGHSLLTSSHIIYLS